MAAIEDARPTAESKLELAERRFALKRKAEDYKLEVAKQRLETAKEKMAFEHQKMTFEHTFGLSIKKQNLDLTTQWIDYMQTVNPDWRWP